MGAPRAWTTISGQTPSSVAISIQGAEALRTVYFDPAFARVEIDTSVTPPRAKVTSGVDLTPITADITALEGRMDTAEAAITTLEGRVTTVENDLGTLQTQVDGIADDIANIITPAISDVQTRVTALEGPGGDYAYLPPLMATAANASYSRNTPGTSYTHGISFYVTKACVCFGVMGVWSVSGTETVRGELWSPAGASLANASVAVSASGLWTVEFGAGVALTPYQLYHVTQCVSGSSATTTYTHGTTGIVTFSSTPIPAGHGLFINSLFRHNTAANTFPNTAGGSFYPVAPRLRAT